MDSSTEVEEVMLKSIAIGMAVVFVSATPAQADGPFGITMGMPIKDLKDCLYLRADKWQCLSVPRPFSAFTTYYVRAHKDAGICSVKAVTDEIPSNSSGAQIKGKFDEIYSQLQEIYGPGTSHDFLMPGSMYRQPQDWMISLKQKDRAFYRDWTASAASPLKNNIKDVTLGASASSVSEGRIVLEYVFENESQCEETVKSTIKSDEKGAL